MEVSQIITVAFSARQGMFPAALFFEEEEEFTPSMEKEPKPFISWTVKRTGKKRKSMSLRVIISKAATSPVSFVEKLPSRSF